MNISYRLYICGYRRFILTSMLRQLFFIKDALTVIKMDKLFLINLDDDL